MESKLCDCSLHVDAGDLSKGVVGKEGKSAMSTP